MKISRKKPFLLFIPLLLVFVIAVNFLFVRNDFKLLETSILTILKDIAEQNSPEPPDISIENVVLRKANDPTDSFNYYRYNTTIILKNHGGDLFDARVILRGGENQKSSLVRNTDEGFTLLSGESYIVRNYEIVFDGKYNGGQIPLEVDIVDKKDYYLENNSYTVDVFEMPAKIKDIYLEEILDDGTFVLDFNSIPFSIRKHDFYVMTGDSAVFDKADVRYDEVYTLDQPYGYHRIKNSFENVEQHDFSENESTELESRFVDFSENGFEDGSTNYVYLKAVNPDNGYYAISNILSFSPDDVLTNARFAKEFVDYADVEIFDDGTIYFEDVNADDWYASSVQTLFNWGLLGTDSSNFLPEQTITRADVLRIVMEYFDADFVFGDGAPHFVDVDEDHFSYPYVESLFENGNGSAFQNYFNPDGPATKKYLIYLVDEFNKNY